ncbi:hypothetical protein VA7868_03853 [Vibrio aerogenes CECT 7868]|uniref:Uncharacterized protein n=1 Tax=Vibrio aerogenes CECT 7868 TaxID=1216006 RepID=A0A1M6BRJ7_9VIBR|nr:hypothetical protein [Vibrio aerogenes]SHI51359.1 hypothetical protein VA7868_03853 [Vibrio aerogenes CECT 7868]
MDKDLLARRLYSERVNKILGENTVDEEVLEEMWENRVSPADAAKMIATRDNGVEASPWLHRYLNRR